jgi:hypothetical protein
MKAKAATRRSVWPSLASPPGLGEWACLAKTTLACHMHASWIVDLLQVIPGRVNETQEPVFGPFIRLLH